MGKENRGAFRAERKAILQAQGKWLEFLAHRDKLRAEGYSVTESDRIATDKFLPQGIKDSVPAAAPVAPEVKKKETPRSGTMKLDRKAVVAGGGVVVREEPEEGTPEVAVRLEQFKRKKRANSRDIVEWVFDHIDVVDVTPEMAPSPGAWSLLMRLRVSSELLKEFYRTVWPKLLPNRTQLDMEERFRDDGRKQFELIQRNLLAFGEPLLPDGSEGSEEEPEIPGGFDPAGGEQPG